ASNSTLKSPRGGWVRTHPEPPIPALGGAPRDIRSRLRLVAQGDLGLLTARRRPGRRLHQSCLEGLEQPALDEERHDTHPEPEDGPFEPQEDAAAPLPGLSGGA